MKKIAIKSFINIIAAIFVFAIFSFDEFLSWIIDKNNDYNYFLLPWWAWGIIGVILFEVFVFVLTKEKKQSKRLD